MIEFMRSAGILLMGVAVVSGGVFVLMYGA